MNSVETILMENAGKPGALFIFPTDVAASRWADHLLRLRGGGTVAMDQFIAWDTFKRESIKSRKQDRQSIPPALRAIFAGRLVRENAELCKAGKPPVFTSLIRARWAEESDSFAAWLRGLLPQLGAWFSRAANLPVALVTGKDAARIAEKFEADDRDLFTLAIRYAQFLDEHGLFEPAWETPPFDDTGMDCFVFFPESLSDYGEYRALLEGSGRVKPVRISDDDTGKLLCDTFFYANSRSEITEAALYIRALNEREQVPWDSIVVSIPDAENYEPYVLREFANRNIPCVKRTGKPLSSYPAGRFFSAVADCASRDFAFSGLTGLLLNRHLPWKDGGRIQKLVDFGIRNNCVTSWVDEEKGELIPVNVWEDAFARPLGGIEKSTRRFFADLKRWVYALRGAASFADIRKYYFSFRGRFFDMDKCPPETDLVLSRCISELTSLVELEKSFPGVSAPDPFMFFIDYLGEINYLAQQNTSGVVILPYRTAAPAPFECHIVLGASQENLSAVFSRLEFLPRNKREKLRLIDEDASAAFINLHKFNSKRPAAFFCSEHTFSGYAIPHSRLGAESKPRQRYGGDPEYQKKFDKDLFSAESGFYVNGVFPSALHENQQAGFMEWFSRRKHQAVPAGKWIADESLVELIHRRFRSNPAFPGKVSVSASSLAPYFRCSLQWLFERVLSPENVHVEAGLMAKNITGQIYHAALNLFFTELRNGGAALSAPLYDNQQGTPELPGTYRDLLARGVNAVFAGFPCLPPDDKPVMSALTARLLLAEQSHFYSRLEKCAAAFLSYFAGYRVIGSETAYRLERDNHFLNGTVDCMLEDAREDSENKGAALIVDFKLRHIPNRADCAGEGESGLADFQLPMYLSLAEKNENRPVHAALFFSIVDAAPDVLFGMIRNVKTNAPVPKKEADRIMRDDGRFRRIMGDFDQKTAQFAEEIGSGEFTVFTPEFKKCGACVYHRICRTTYKIGREYQLTAWGNDDEI
jgi:hypothetical protein